MLPSVALGINVLNALAWPRVSDSDYAARVSVLIPARNEERGIERAVRSVFESGTDVLEVIVYDDGSTDQTPDILQRLQTEYPKLRVEKGIGLPDGWVGKPHACHRLASFASGDLLLFLDADVEVLPGGLKHVLGLFADKRADLVTAVPRQVTGSFFERLVLPVLHLTYASWLPMPMVWLSSDPRFLAANGQVLAVKRSTYDEVGGFEAVRAEVVDDMAFCTRVKRANRRVVFADGHHIARCRMYTNAKGVWEGFSKNLYEGIGGSWIALLGVLGLYTTTFILPYAALIASIWLPQLATAAGVAVAINLAIRLLLAVRHKQPLEGVLLHPVSVVALLAIAMNSWWWNRRGAIHWSGRVYAARPNRQA
ncbi:MAG: glycosyltransferase family 2 protein [bacterium]